MRILLKSKIHRATVTGTNLNYGGSVTIAKDLMDRADILPYEQVTVLNLNNGERFVTYAIEGDRGQVCLNGACARLAEEGDKVIILSYGITDYAEIKAGIPPIIVYVDEKNAVIDRSTCSSVIEVPFVLPR